MPTHVSERCAGSSVTRHDPDAGELAAIAQLLEPFAAITPGLSHHAPSARVQDVEHHEGHIPAGSLPLMEHGLDALMPIARARLTVDHGGLDGPDELAEPTHAGMPQQVQA